MIEKVTEGIYLIDTKALGIERFVAAYLLVDEKVVLVDVGYPSSAGVLTSSMDSVGIKPSSIDLIIATHVHLDHAGAAGHLVSMSPKAKVIAHPKGLRHLLDPSRLIESVKSIYGPGIFDYFGYPMPIGPDRVLGVKDGESIELGNKVLKVLYTEGHAPHHLSVYEESTGSLFTGDTVSGFHVEFPANIPASMPSSFELEKAKEDLRRLISLNPKLLLTPHFGVRHDAIRELEAEISLLDWWAGLVKEIARKAKDEDESLEMALDALLKRYGLKPSRVPEHVRTVVRLAIQGMLGYLSRSGLL